MSGAPRPGRAADVSALRAALDSVSESVVIADVTGCVEYANVAARSSLGLAPGERVGLPDSDPLTWLSWVANRRIRTVVDRDGTQRTIIVAHIDKTTDERSNVRLAGTSVQASRLREAIAAAGITTEPVLVSGETGTGKESVARAVHESSRLSAPSFETVAAKSLSVAALNRRLEERSSAGSIGTIFLDDVDGLTRAVQRRLAQAIAQNEVRPRLMASTRVDIEASVESGVFDRELFFRLNAIPLHVSPLRERPGDVAPLAEAVIRSCNARSAKRRVEALAPDALDVMAAYAFPGNARELESIVERAWHACRGKRIRLDHLPEAVTRPSRRTRKSVAERVDEDALEGLEREFLLRVLADNDWRLGAVALELSVSRTTLWRRLRRLRIPNPRRGRA